MWDELLYGWGGPGYLQFANDQVYPPSDATGGLGVGTDVPPIPDWAAPYISPEQWSELVSQARTASMQETGGTSPGMARAWSGWTPEERFTSLLNQSAAQALPQGVHSPYGGGETFKELLPLAVFGGTGIGSAIANIGAGAAAGAGAGEAATTFPYVAGGSVTGSAIPGITSSTTLAGATAAGLIPAVTGGAGAGPTLDSSGYPIPGTEPPAGGGGLGGLLGNLFGGEGAATWGPLLGGLLGAIDANNQPDSMTTNQGGTSTSTYGQTLPGEITGPASQALSSLQGLFGNGYQVAGVDPATTAAVSRLQNLGVNPFASGGMQNNAPTASGFANGGIANNAPVTSMFAGGQTINPYLDNVFNTAANALQPRLASEFSHAGRLNSDSHQQARSQELQTLAASIYAPAFEAERSRQYGAAESGVDRLLAQMEGNLGRQYGAQESALSRLLAQTDSNLARQYGAVEGNLGRELSSIYPMLQAGDMLRGYQQEQLDAPWLNMQRYLTGLQGMLPFYPGTQTQSTQQEGSVTNPLFNNPLAGFLGGAQLGSLFAR